MSQIKMHLKVLREKEAAAPALKEQSRLMVRIHLAAEPDQMNTTE